WRAVIADGVHHAFAGELHAGGVGLFAGAIAVEDYAVALAQDHALGAVGVARFDADGDAAFIVADDQRRTALRLVKPVAMAGIDVGERAVAPIPHAAPQRAEAVRGGALGEIAIDRVNRKGGVAVADQG